MPPQQLFDSAAAGPPPVGPANVAAVEPPAAPPRSGPALDTAAPPDAAPAPETEATAPFDFQRCWYPLATIESLKPDRPQALQLLGMELVVFKDKEGGWAALEDMCPHRLAPLSDGRITEKGDLMCSYHGWTFDSKGSCTSIPQIGDAKAQTAACASRRACVKRFPTQVRYDLLWVYADPSPEAWASAFDAPPAMGLEDMGSWEGPDATMVLKQPWFQRDTPVGLDVMLENFLDPAHVPFSHHGVIGSRKQDTRIDLALLDADAIDRSNVDWSTQDQPSGEPGGPGSIRRDVGFAVRVTNPFASYVLDFQPPCRVRHRVGPGEIPLILYGTPTALGWSRVFVTFAGLKTEPRQMPHIPGSPPLLRGIADALTQVKPLFHAIIQNAIIDGDHGFLQCAERAFWRRGGLDSWPRQYYMPSTSDAGVIAWRRWLDKFGGSLPTLPRGAADLPPASKAEVFDRYHQHTVHCPACMGAFRAVTGALFALAGVAAAAAGAAIAAAASGGLPTLSRIAGPCGAVLAAAALLAVPLMRLRQKFIGEEYVHADR